MDLPPGVIPVREDVIQSTIISLTLNPFFAIDSDEVYVTTIDGVDFTYNVNVGDDLDDIGTGVRNSIPGAMSATYEAGTNRLTVDGPLPGKRFSIVVNEPAFNGVDFGVVTSTQVITKITLKGSPMRTIFY